MQLFTENEGDRFSSHPKTDESLKSKKMLQNFPGLISLIYSKAFQLAMLHKIPLKIDQRYPHICCKSSADYLLMSV